MKRMILFLAVPFIMAACNNATQENTNKTDTAVETSASENIIKVPGRICFHAIIQRDTIRVELFIKDSLVNGNLVYNFFEKDDNKGAFSGKISGDIIKADYTFLSEGTASVREVMFRLKDNTLTEGYGDMEEKDNRSVFKDPSRVQFTQLYNSIDCK
ncbi:hypothetical protein BH10BAC2_BH10BAC2_46930 [soil metagenome]